MGPLVDVDASFLKHMSDADLRRWLRAAEQFANRHPKQASNVTDTIQALSEELEARGRARVERGEEVLV